MGKRILVIPDYHAHPDFDNKRAALIGKHIAERAPDRVICSGDFTDLPSLNRAASKSEGIRSLEGRRYQKDLEASYDANETLWNAYHENTSAPQPPSEMLLGNHEEFINRLLGEDPRLEGKVSVDDLCYEDYGWRVHPFKEAYIYAGWAFCHFFSSGDMGRPIGGANVAASLVRKLHMSAVVGHNHRFDFFEEVRPDGKKVTGISAGCIAHPRDIGLWNKQTAPSWFYGLIEIDGAASGQYTSITATTLAKLEEMYK